MTWLNAYRGSSCRQEGFTRRALRGGADQRSAFQAGSATATNGGVRPTVRTHPIR